MLSGDGGGGGGRGGDFDFLKIFLSNLPPWESQNGSNQVKSPQFGRLTLQRTYR